MADVLFVSGFLGGDDARDVGRLAGRLARRGVASRLLCPGGARGLVGAIEVPGLLDRWRRAWRIRRLEPPESAVELLHGLGLETAEAVLDLAERWSRPYVLTIEDYLGAGASLRLSREWCRGLVVPSTDLAEDLTRSLGIPPQQVDVLLPGLELPLLAERPASRRDVPIVAAAGGADAEDGLAVFFEGARKVLDRGIDAEFVVDAPRAAEPGLRRLARALAVDDRVTFADPTVADEAFWPVLDVFCQPTLAADPGRPLAVAMGHAVPCVASDVPGLRAWIADGQTGVLVPPGDAAALAAAIERLLREPESARALGDRARAFVSRRCDPEHEADLLAAIYRRVLAEAATPPAAWPGTPAPASGDPGPGSGTGTGPAASRRS
jgi:glycosyltransferase involved in cell wall biosynthesis